MMRGSALALALTGFLNAVAVYEVKNEPSDAGAPN